MPPPSLKVRWVHGPCFHLTVLIPSSYNYKEAWPQVPDPVATDPTPEIAA
jgi:hypothetical protein